MTRNNWAQAVLSFKANIGDAIRSLNNTALRIVLVVNEAGEFLGTVSDGDIRRGLLKNLQVDDSIRGILNSNALVVPPELSREMVLRLMAANKIQQIPVIDKDGMVLGLHLWDDIARPQDRENLMIIMAGGMGKRLHPFTEACPKPMLPIAGKPMLEHIIERAKLEGFSRFVLAVYHLSHVIEDYFGNGSKFGVQIDYLREESPLGTAGALSLLGPLSEAPILVTNGDVMTDVRYGEIIDFHIRHSAIATMAVRLHEWHHPFGVVQTNGVEIVGFEEKPVTQTYINAGIYVLDPTALSALKTQEHCDMPVLFERLKAENNKTIAYPMHEPWLDVGRLSDYAAIKEEFSSN